MFGAIEGGYAVLVDELVRRAGIRWVQVAVERVNRSPRRLGRCVDDEGGRHHADAAVLAVPAPRLPRLVEGVAPRTAAAARRIGGGLDGAGGVGAAGRHSAARSSPGCWSPAENALRAKAITLSTRSGAAAATSELVRLSYGRFGDDLARSAGDEDLLAWAAQDLATVFGVGVEPVDCHVQRWIDAMPQYGPGHGELVAELRAGLPPTLAVAGRLSGRHRRARLRGRGDQGGRVAGRPTRVAR